MRESFAAIGVVPGVPWPPEDMTEETRQIIREVQSATAAEMEQAIQASTSTADWFGMPEDMRGKLWQRALGAMGGIYGNTAAEALYPSYMVDADGQPLDGANRYTLRLPADALPPAKAFWSITMYDAKTRFLVENPLDRYLINSEMLAQLKTEENGDIVLYLQHESPGKELESNWLPAPAGPFAVVMRLYLPKSAALDGSWKPEPIVKMP